MLLWFGLSVLVGVGVGRRRNVEGGEGDLEGGGERGGT